MPFHELSFPKDSETPVPLVVILPILGQIMFMPDFWIEKQLANYFRKKGYATAIVKRDFFSFTRGQGIKQIEDYLANTVDKARRTINHALKDSRIDAEKVLSLGISFGGITNVLLTAQDNRIKAGILAFAGGNIPEIIATSKEPLLKAYCGEISKGLGISHKELVRSLKENFNQEPLDVAASIPAEKILMVIAKYDHVILPKYAHALKDALGGPQTIYLPLGHYLSLLALPYLERQAHKFFQKRLTSVNC